MIPTILAILAYLSCTVAYGINRAQRFGVPDRWERQQWEIASWERERYHDLYDVEPEPVAAMIASDVAVFFCFGLIWPLAVAIWVAESVIRVAIEVTDVR